MALTTRRGRFGVLTILAVAACLTATPVGAQPRSSYNERVIEPDTHAQDKDGVWTLHFRFKDPRIITVDIPGRGRKIVWYMWYQVYNMTGEPRPFTPEFELVTLDRNTGHMDEVLPSAQEAIRKEEDRYNRQDIKNSVSIQKELIPVTKKDSFPRAVTGVAIWSDVYDRAANTNRFSIYVSGLSDGLTKDDRGVIRRKTLRLDFTRLGDARVGEAAGDIRWTENATWIYRATVSTGLAEPAKEGPAEPKDEKKGDEPEPKKKDDEKKDEKKDNAGLNRLQQPVFRARRN